jgi:hypothetical protein
MLEIRYARHEREVDDAIELSCHSFSIPYEEMKKIKVAMRYYLPDDFRPERFIVGVKDGAIVAVHRHYLRTILIGGVNIDILGLADYCIDKSKVDNLFGVGFYMRCCEMLRKSIYPFALGSARRAMENYYYRFGHIGNDSYCKCRAEKLKPVDNIEHRRLELCEHFDANRIADYEEFRKNAFSSEWGMVLRSTNFWKWIGCEVVSFNKFRFFEAFDKDTLVGYAIISHNNCIDFGLREEGFEGYAYSLVEQLSRIISLEELIFNISPANRLFASLGTSNLSYSMRYVPDEGIVALGLNRIKLVETFCGVLEKNANSLDRSSSTIVIGEDMRFSMDKGKMIPLFDPMRIKRTDEQLILNNLFLGTYGPFSLARFSGPRILPPTFFRINDLDAM